MKLIKLTIYPAHIFALYNVHVSSHFIAGNGSNAAKYEDIGLGTQTQGSARKLCVQEIGKDSLLPTPKSQEQQNELLLAG